MADNQGQPDPTANLSSTASPPAPAQADPAPATAASSTTTQPTPAPTEAQASPLDGVDSRDAYETLLKQTLDALPEETPPGEPATTTATPETPGQAAPPANETTTEQPPAAETETDIPDRIRLGSLSEKDRALTSAAVLLAKAEGISIVEAMARMTGKPAGDATATAPAQADPALPDPAAIQARIAELEQEEDAAANDADTVKMAKIHRDIRKAEAELREAQAAHVDAAQTAQQQFMAGVQKSRAEARELYPQLKDAKSPLAVKWIEVATRLEAAQDPLVTGNNPNFAKLVAQMAAAELGIAPAAKGAPAQPSPTTSTPAPVAQPATRPVQPAPGSAKTTAPSNPTGQLESRLASVKNTDDYEALVRDALAVA